jgi:hypothetical protein
MKRFLLSILAGILLIYHPAPLLNVCGQTSQMRANLTPEEQDWLKRAGRHEKNGWTYLHIEGGPRERGFQHGYLLAIEIKEGLRLRRDFWHHSSGMEWEWLVGKSAKMYTPKVDPENLAEIDGIVEGMKAAGVSSTRDEMIAYNGFIDLGSYWWPKEKKKFDSESPNPKKQSCSSFIATGSMTVDGSIVLGHNTMDDYPKADFYVVLDIQPAKGHRILMQTSPGWIHSGTDFFITDAGLVGSETTIGGFKKFDEKGIPEFVRMRRATQDGSTIDEWCDVMKKGNNGGYANAWLLGDVKTNEIARLELGLKYVGFEKKKDGFFIGSNVAEDLKILRLETDRNDTDIRLSSVARRVRWKQLMKENVGKITLEIAKAFEADHYDPYLQKENPGGRSLCGHFDLDPQPFGVDTPFDPSGSIDAKVVDSRMAREMSFAARWGFACGMPFDAKKFLDSHAQFDWMEGMLKDRPSQPWTVFKAGEKE